jgi:hypothetical protein
MVLTEQTQAGKARSQVDVRNAEQSDRPELARVLARAFDADPIVNWMVRQDEKRTERFERSWTPAAYRRDVARPCTATY